MNQQITRRAQAPLTPSTFNPETRTVEAIISTGAPVERIDRFGSFSEILDLDAIDPAKLLGLTVLTDHDQSARASIGKIVAAGRSQTGLIATIQLSSAADVTPIMERIADGTLSSVSIGYRVSRWAEKTTAGKRTKTAVDWSIFEVSIVAIPADPAAKIRNSEVPDTVEIETPETSEPTALETRAVIRSIAREAGLSSEWADTQIDGDASIVEARAAAFEEMTTRTTPRIRVTALNDDAAAVHTRREDALHARMSGTAPADESRQYMNESLRDIARSCVEASGQSTRAMTPDELFRAAMHTTSDFPNLLTGAGNRTLLASYEAAQSPIKTALSKQSTLPDFRAASKLRLSDIGLLEKVSETGEIKHTTRGESVESYALDTYATQFSISRKALINDDLGAFADWGQTAGRMAAQTEANLLFNLLLSNPTMGEDKKPLFSADHNNNEAVLALDIAGLSAARKSLREMKALDGTTPINVTPKFLLVGPELETTAERLLAELSAAQVDAVNPFAGKLTLLVEPRITGSSWYVFAAPSNAAVLEYAYLSSAQGPQMASREGWDVLGMEFRVVLDFGAGAIDWRGAFRAEAIA